MFGRVLTIVQIVIGLIMTVLNTVFGVQFYGEWEINPEHFGPNTLSSEYYVYDGPNDDGKDDQVVNLYDIRTGEAKEIFKVDGEQDRVHGWPKQLEIVCFSTCYGCVSQK